MHKVVIEKMKLTAPNTKKSVFQVNIMCSDSGEKKKKQCVLKLLSSFPFSQGFSLLHQAFSFLHHQALAFNFLLYFSSQHICIFLSYVASFACFTSILSRD
jgi:hypothetical protein